MKNMKMTNAMRIKLLCLATSAMAMTVTHLTAQVFTTLHNFPACGDYPYVNVGGAFPTGELILSGNTLYGTTQSGGSSGNGTVFSMNTDGTGFTTLRAFHGLNDGSDPLDGVLLSGDTLYGPANMGGSPEDYGTVFTIKTNGTGFETLHTFDGLSDQAYPYGGLMLLGNTLYATTYEGGRWGSGTVFSLSFTPQPTVIPSGGNLILTWPTNYSGFTVQSTTNLGSSAVWATNSPAPVVVNGQNTVTNPMTGSQQFFRLSQ